jgi:CBS-domain-containing membrane protein
MKVQEVMTSHIQSCRPQINLAAAAAVMWEYDCGAWPVVNAEGLLQGILCLNDIALRAEEAQGKHLPALAYEEAMSTLKALCEHRAAKVAAPA